eukprot:6461272-Amphidinium_carterae.1
MAAGGQRDVASAEQDARGDSASVEARDMLEAVHKNTPVGDRVKEYRVRRVNKLPGQTYASKKGAPCKRRWDYFVEYATVWPHLFKIESKDTALKLNIDLAKFEAVMSGYEASQFGGSWDEWGSVFAHKEVVADRGWQTHDHHERVESASNSAGVLLECISVAALKEYSMNHRDRHPEEIMRYLNAVGEDGRLLVNCCRKHDLPGRRYATSASLQHLTREARAAAVGGDVD